MKRRVAVAAPILLGLCMGAAAESLEECGYRVTSTRNAEERVCYNELGPKSEVWSVANQEPLNNCLAKVQTKYRIGWSECHAPYLTEPAWKSVDPHNAAVVGAGALSIILLFAL